MFVGVYTWWYLYEQDLLVWFYTRKLVALGAITDGVILSYPTKIKDFGDAALIKPYCLISFKGIFLINAALSTITVDLDVAPPIMVYIFTNRGLLNTSDVY